MRGRTRRQALTLAMLAALASPPLAGWLVVLHLGEADHHAVSSHDHGDDVALEAALHGHTHESGTPPHGHPLVTAAPARIPAKLIVAVPAVLGAASELVTAGVGIQQRPAGGPTHDPPPRAPSRPVLRI